MNPDVKLSWDEFLNPQVVRPRLIAASLYIAVFEALKDAIVDRVRDFFWVGFDDKINLKYESDVLVRNRSPVFACLDWLKDMNAIDDNDVAAFNRVKACRNSLAHGLLNTLGCDGLPPGFEGCFVEMMALLHKIEIWWIHNYEIPINSDFDGTEVDEKEIIPGRIAIIQLLLEIALGDEKQSRYYHNEFRKQNEDT